MTASHPGDATLLYDAIWLDDTRLRLFLGDAVHPAGLILPEGVVIQGEPVVVNGLSSVICVAPAKTETLVININGQDIVVQPCSAEPALMAGRNVIVAERNGEPVATVFDWLHYHVTRYQMSGVVLLDRARPGAEPDFADTLNSRIEQAGLDCPVVILRAPVPLGKPDLPPEAHPFNVAESPGKDRMHIPPADPWLSPLGYGAVYELIRARFVEQARAIANIDVHDLLSGIQIFDEVHRTPQGVLPVKGRHCFPWRIPEDAPAHFGDHICVQFDTRYIRNRWCVAPAKLPKEAVLRMVRIGNAVAVEPPQGSFFRFMALRHITASVSQLAPKTSLIEHLPLLRLVEEAFDAKPGRVPEVVLERAESKNGRRAIITCMKNEGPFILEWLAYHRAIGFDDFLIYTNDCTDGTDQMFDLLEAKGLVQHRDNPYQRTQMGPQHAALQAGETEPVIKDAEWVTCIDVDEFVNIKVGDGTLDALFAAVPNANMISMTWRLFGNSDMHEFRDGLTIEQFHRCAPEFANKPHQAWGFKTLYQHIGLFRKLGVHRPKGLNSQLWTQINWVNGSGKPLPERMFRNAWRSDTGTYGYDLVQLNHYAVRSAESFLVKRDRGRVNHVDRDQGLSYWFRMNNNYTEDRSILCRVPMARAEYDRLLADPEIRAMHETCVANHRAKIDELLATENYARFYDELTTPRLEKLSRLHPHFGANVFLRGPDVVPDEIIAKDPQEEFFFTVDEGETMH